MLVLQDTYRRIVRVDLKFPDELSLSTGAQDFVRQASAELLSRKLDPMGSNKMCM
jgi:hypothetical protein